jgi:hypothetical protein
VLGFEGSPAIFAAMPDMAASGAITDGFVASAVFAYDDLMSHRSAPGIERIYRFLQLYYKSKKATTQTLIKR